MKKKSIDSANCKVAPSTGSKATHNVSLEVMLHNFVEIKSQNTLNQVIFLLQEDPVGVLRTTSIKSYLHHKKKKVIFIINHPR